MNTYYLLPTTYSRLEVLWSIWVGGLGPPITHPRFVQSTSDHQYPPTTGWGVPIPTHYPWVWVGTGWVLGMGTQCRTLLLTLDQASLFSGFLLISGIFPKLRSEKLPKITVTWHFSLVQRRVKNGRTLTVKGMVKNCRNFNSEVTTISTSHPRSP
jgi:hypothetical protein